MKVIDKQGRLFGKINIIDLIFLILLVGALGAGFMRLTKDPIPTESLSQAEIELHVQGIGPVGAEAIKVGQEIYHYDNNELMGTVQEVEIEPLKDLSNDEGQWVETEVPNAYLVKLTIEGPVIQGSITNQTGGQDLLIGSEYRLKSNVSTFAGTCMGFTIHN